MTEALRSWILGLCGAAAVCAIALIVCPEGRVRRVLQIICGAVMAIALISPIADFDLDSYSSALAEYRERARAAASSATRESDRLSRAIIQDECAAYILDKAAELGIELSDASVSAVWNNDGYWYPWDARLGCRESPALSERIEAELGIPAERQYWEDG